MSVLAAASYLALPEDQTLWVLKRLLPTKGLLNIYALPKAGKSHAALQLCEAVANPERGDWLGFPVDAHGPSLYIQIDTPRMLWKSVIRKLEGKGLDFSNVYIADREMMPFPFNVLEDGGAALAEAVADVQPLVVVIDTIREIHALNENDSQDMKRVMDAILVACWGCAIVVISHAKKAATGPSGQPIANSLINNNRGSGYIPGKMDGILCLERRKVQWQSRAAPEAVFPVRSEDGMILLEEGDVAAAAVALSEALATGDAVNIRDLSRTLSAQFPTRTEESFRSILRRLQKDLFP